ncbi:MAG: response regulator [Lachnospiraceae bacterium]|nr:response regulator [Lachnospiraceae bacterium]
MYKILIADDESIMIDALKFIIEHHFPNQCMIECASTGRKVIELAENFRPHIVFMDIQMPGINGIEAMKEIRKSNENMIFIVVSAYLKFDYAKDAINIGVLDYINKPIEKEVIIQVLQKAMDRVDAVKKRRSEELSNREKLEIVSPIIENGLIYSLIYENAHMGELNNYKTLLGIEADAGYIMSIQFAEVNQKESMEYSVGTTVRVQKDYGKVKDVVKAYFDGCVGAVMGNMILVFVPQKQPSQDEEYTLRITTINEARKMVRELRRAVDAWFRVGIGSVKDLSNLVESYNEAMRSLTANRTESVVHVKDLPAVQNYEEDYPVEEETLLFKNVESGDVNRATFHARNFFQWMVSHHGEDWKDVQLKVLEFVLRAEQIGVETGGMSYRFSMRSEYLDVVENMASPEALYDWLIVKLTNVCHGILAKREESTGDVIQEAKNYIEENYSKDLILDEVSRQMQISPYYFSKLFRKKTGSTFIEYVTNVRMEHAKDLLRNTNKSMKEISIEVGYSDANYFSRTFKKNVGVTPSEYKDGKNANS